MHIPWADNGVADALSWDNTTSVSFLLPQALLEHIGDPRLVGLLIDQGVADSTLRSYISGKKHYLEFCSHCYCRPLSVSEIILLSKILRLRFLSPCNLDHIMLWAAFCLGYFGFMRSGGFTCPSMDEFTADLLRPHDVAVDSRSSPSHAVVYLKCSKNYPFSVGTSMHFKLEKEKKEITKCKGKKVKGKDKQK